MRSPKEIGSKENNHDASGKFSAEQHQKRKVKMEKTEKNQENTIKLLE